MNPVDLDTAIEVLTRLHNAAEGDPGICPKDRYFYGKWPQNFSRRIAEMKLMKTGAIKTG